MDGAPGDDHHDRPTLTGPVDEPNVTWNEEPVTGDPATAGVVRADAPAHAHVTATTAARDLPLVNGIQYGRDSCPECGSDWDGYTANVIVGTAEVEHSLVCVCGHAERERQPAGTYTRVNMDSAVGPEGEHGD